MSRFKKITRIGVLLLFALAMVAAFIPWRSLVESKLTEVLRSKGFEDVKITVEQAGFSSLTLGTISIGGKAPVALQHLTLHYSPLDLWRGRLQEAVFSGLSLRMNDITVTTGETRFATLPTAQQEVWRGEWSVKGIALEGIPVALPATEASGTLELTSAALKLEGSWQSTDKTVAARFALNYPMNAPAQASLTVHTLTIPWNKGSLGLKSAVIPFSGSYTLPVLIRSVSVDSLLQPLTGNRAKATGNVSGTLPLLIRSGAMPVPRGGHLQAEAPGTLSMEGDAIAGDNAQIGVLRDVLKDFHYKLLSFTLDSDKGNTLSAMLALEGNNPAMYEGRPVKLNVHLSGDVLDFITQNMAAQNTEQLLKKAR